MSLIKNVDEPLNIYILTVDYREKGINYKPIDKAFAKYLKEKLNKSDIDTFALIWNEAADKAFAGILGKRQLEIIKEAGSISTFIDKDSQLKHIQSVVCELNEELDVVKTNAAGKMKAYIVTGISAGLILVIVLI